VEHRPQMEVWLTAAQCAQRIGISIRALRLYEDHGLITPRRTAKDWRLYGTREIARLNEVLVLKGFGLSLGRIAELLKGRPVDLRQLLDLQHETLLGMRERAEKGLRIIETARTSLAAGESIALDDLTNLAREAALGDKPNDDRAWRRYEQARPRTEISIEPALYDDYAGAYQLEDEQFVLVVREGDRFFTRILGQPNLDLFPEAVDRFFSKIMPVQVTFERDGGRVVSLTVHQNGFERRASRVDPDSYRRAEEMLQQRIRDQSPLPDSEAIARNIVETHIAGTPDYDRMTSSLAAIARDISRQHPTERSGSGRVTEEPDVQGRKRRRP
jgi:DNA-binding transcriptional MerR regulator